MPTLVTGLEGFVGQHLLQAFPDSYFPVYGTTLAEAPPAKRAVSYRHLDISEMGNLEAYLSDVQPRRIIHLAAISNVGLSINDPALTFRVNIEGSFRLLEAVRLVCPRARVLLVGSGEVHGDATPSSPKGFRETDQTVPASPYAASKLAMEALGQSYARTYGLNIVISRSFNHTGPGQPERFIFSHIAKTLVEIKKGLHPAEIPVGDISVERDFLDVRDVAQAYLALLEKGHPGEIYNVSSGKAQPLSAYIDLLIQASGVQAKTIVDPSRKRSCEIPRFCGDNTKLMAETGWNLQYDLRTTFAEMIEYWSAKV